MSNEKLTLGELRKMIEGLPDDIIIGYSREHSGGSDNWGWTSSSWTAFYEIHNSDINLNLEKKNYQFVKYERL